MRIVVAANPEADQPWVADAAAQLAKQTAGSVAVVSVDEVELERLAPLPRSAYVERAERAASTAVERLAAAGVEATKTVLSGPALEGIMDFAEQQQADVIVVGASARSALTERLLGSVPLELIRRARRPVLVVAREHR
jgi:nucleotide-binding universal stress UspA family protein